MEGMFIYFPAVNETLNYFHHISFKLLFFIRIWGLRQISKQLLQSYQKILLLHDFAFNIFIILLL